MSESNISASEMEDFVTSIDEFDLRESDFTINETDLTDYSGISLVPRGTIEIAYAPTGSTKKYNTGHFSLWPSEFQNDLKLGFYTKT